MKLALFSESRGESEVTFMSRHESKRNRPNGVAPRQPATGSYFLSLTLENIRCFSAKQVLELSGEPDMPARWTILLGENGTGKTTILQLLAAFERACDPAAASSLTRDERRRLLFTFSMTEGIIRDRDGSGPKFAIDAIDGVNLAGRQIQPIRYQCEGNCDSGNRVTITVPSRMPPMCYAYGTGRRLGVSSLNPEKLNAVDSSPFFEDTKLLNAEEWLLRLDYSASKASKIRERQKARLETAKAILVKVLPDVAEVRLTAPTAEKTTPAVEFKTPYGWVPLGQLGYGYRTMIAWVVDFTSRMVERYPDSANPLAEPAVVLVDEIDLHLHPKWQRELIGVLTEWFPNTQFIATAHSPLIVQAAPDANLVLLRRQGDHVVIENDPETIRGWRVDQILTSELFGFETARPPGTEKLLMRRKELLTKPRLSRSNQKEIEEIDAKLQLIPTGESFEHAKTMALIEKSLEILKKKQSANS